MMHCECGRSWEWTEVNELEAPVCLGIGKCPQCQNSFGVEAEAKNIGLLLRVFNLD